MFNLLYTNKTPSMRSLNYVPGSGVGAKSPGVRAALRRRAIYGTPNNGCCTKNSVFNGYYWIIVQDGILSGADVYVGSKLVGKTNNEGGIAIPTDLSGVIHVENGMDISTNLPNT